MIFVKNLEKEGAFVKGSKIYWMILAICLSFLGGWLCHDLVTPVQVSVEVADVVTVTQAPVMLEVIELDLDDDIPIVNINTATVDELALLPNIGTIRAQNIIAYRQENGPFFVAEELTLVEGIGEGILEDVLPYITVE